MWLLKWHQRNKAREKESPWRCKIQCTRQDAMQVNTWECFVPTKRNTALQQQTSWEPLEPDTVIINVDGAFTVGEDHGGWGMIARDTNGVVIEDKAKCAEHVREAFLDEL